MAKNADTAAKDLLKLTTFAGPEGRLVAALPQLPARSLVFVAMRAPALRDLRMFAMGLKLQRVELKVRVPKFHEDRFLASEGLPWPDSEEV
jgi:hypothetical protein